MFHLDICGSSTAVLSGYPCTLGGTRISLLLCMIKRVCVGVSAVHMVYTAALDLPRLCRALGQGLGQGIYDRHLTILLTVVLLYERHFNFAAGGATSKTKARQPRVEYRLLYTSRKLYAIQAGSIEAANTYGGDLA